jgi:hypothetical protein
MRKARRHVEVGDAHGEAIPKVGRVQLGQALRQAGMRFHFKVEQIFLPFGHRSTVSAHDLVVRVLSLSIPGVSKVIRT